MMQAISMGEKLLTVSGEYRNVTPPETLVRWDLEETDGVTKVTLTHPGVTDEDSRGTYRGWVAILGGLASFVTEDIAFE